MNNKIAVVIAGLALMLGLTGCAGGFKGIQIGQNMKAFVHDAHQAELNRDVREVEELGRINYTDPNAQINHAMALQMHVAMSQMRRALGENTAQTYIKARASNINAGLNLGAGILTQGIIQYGAYKQTKQNNEVTLRSLGIRNQENQRLHDLINSQNQAEEEEPVTDPVTDPADPVTDPTDPATDPAINGDPATDPFIQDLTMSDPS